MRLLVRRVGLQEVVEAGRARVALTALLVAARREEQQLQVPRPQRLPALARPVLVQVLRQEVTAVQRDRLVARLDRGALVRAAAAARSKAGTSTRSGSPSSRTKSPARTRCRDRSPDSRSGSSTRRAWRIALFRLFADESGDNPAIAPP